MSRTWFTSDLHIGHRLVAGHRGFFDADAAGEPDPAAHDKWLADLWDSTVSDEDIVFVLGDVSMNFKPYVSEWVRQRPGTKHLITGNHDSVHPMHSTALRHLEKWTTPGLFSTVQPSLRRRYNGHEVLLSHFPYIEQDGDEGRRAGSYPQWRLPDLGVPLIHGHTHGPEKEHRNEIDTWSDIPRYGSPQLHVGIDAWRRFLSIDYVINWLGRVS